MPRHRSDLRPSQLRLIDEMIAFPDGIMVLGMGAGKTASCLTAFADMQAKGTLDRMIVIAPARVVDNVWPHEPAKWSHLAHLDVKACVGRPPARRKILEGAWDVLVVSHDNMPLTLDTFDESEDLQRTMFVIDEMSKFKSPRSKRGKKLLKHRDRFSGIWGLTGTPRPNGYEDLFMPIKLVGGEDVWGYRSFTEWRNANFMALDFKGYNWRIHEFAKKGITDIAATFMATTPPDKLDKPVLHTGPEFVRHVEMTDEQAGYYKEMLKHLLIEMPEDVLIQAMSRGAAGMKLTQIVQGFVYNEQGEVLPLNENPKLDMLVEMDDELGGDRAVINYGFRAEIDQIQTALSHRRLGLLGGGVSTQAANDTIDDWNAGKIDRLLIHPASAGHGIELQFGGHHMIHYHPTWSPEMYDQVIKRLDRPGQTHEVFNWWISARNTVDEIKFDRVEAKLADEEIFKRSLHLLK